MKTNIPFYRRLLFRVTALLVLVVLSIEVIIGLSAIRLAKEKFHHAMLDSFQTTITMTENFFALVGQMGQAWSDHFFRDAELGRLVTLQDNHISPELMAHFKEESTADVVIILDGDGRVLGHTEKPEMVGKSLMSWQMVRKAAIDNEVSLTIVQDLNSLIIYSPSLIYSEAGDKVVGSIFIGYVLNDELISGMKKDTLTDITIVRRRGVMASTFNTREQRLIDIPMNYITYQSLLKEGHHGDTTAHMRLNDIDYFVYARKLSLMDPSMEGSILLSYPQSELQAVITNLLQRFYFISAFSFIVIVLVSWRFSDRLLAPLKHLLIHTTDIENTDSLKSIQIDDRGEIGVLTQRFNALLQSIQQKNKDLHEHSEALEATVQQRTQALQQSNEELKDQGLRLSNAQRIACLGSLEWNPDNDQIRCSEQLYEILGAEKGSLTSLDDIYKYIHDDDLDRVRHTVEHASPNQAEQIEFRIYRSGEELRDISSEMELTLEGSGEHHRLTATLHDITERKQAEQNQIKLQHQLQQAQKMEAIGQLTGGIAHDFNNILGAIMGYTELVKEKTRDIGDEKMKRHVDEIYKSSERARDLVARMLSFSRESQSGSKPMSITPIIKETLSMLDSTLLDSIGIHTDFEENLPAVVSNPIQLHQLVMNICSNARDAMDGIGQLDISLKQMQFDETQCASCHSDFKGKYVVLSIQDSGDGIDDQVLERIFDPFYTTKGVGKGTGMGLSMVHGIMHEHGGHILVESSSDGTTFHLLFPESKDGLKGT